MILVSRRPMIVQESYGEHEVASVLNPYFDADLMAFIMLYNIEVGQKIEVPKLLPQSATPNLSKYENLTEEKLKAAIEDVFYPASIKMKMPQVSKERTLEILEEWLSQPQHLTIYNPLLIEEWKDTPFSLGKNTNTNTNKKDESNSNSD